MNLAEIIQPHPEDAVALVSRGTPTTYGALREQVAALRGGLSALGLGRDDRVAILCANNPYLRRLVSGRARHRRRRRPPQPPSPAPELERELAAVETIAVIVGPAGARAAGRRRARERAVGAARDRDRGSPVRRCPHLRRPARPTRRRSSTVPTTTSPCCIFTSGTAGSPKAAMLTHGNLLVQPPPDPGAAGRGLEPDDVVLGVLPMFHIFGLNVVLGLALYAGASRRARRAVRPASPPSRRSTTTASR